MALGILNQDPDTTQWTLHESQRHVEPSLLGWFYGLGTIVPSNYSGGLKKTSELLFMDGLTDVLPKKLGPKPEISKHHVQKLGCAGQP